MSDAPSISDTATVYDAALDDLPAAVVQVYRNAQLSADAIAFLFSSEFSVAFQDVVEEIGRVYRVSREQAIEEFRRLLAIKTFTFDVNATKISPTSLMDELWHAAVLDTQFYANLQAALGLTLHHRPSGALPQNKEAREIRLSAMKSLYRSIFGSDPLEYTNQVLNGAQPGDPSGGIQVFITGVGGEQKHIVAENLRVGRLKNTIYEQVGLPAYNQRLFFAGRQLEDFQTLRGCGIRDQDTLHLSHKPLWPAPTKYSPSELTNGIQIFVRTLDGRCKSVRMMVDSTIDDVKGACEALIGIPRDEQRMVLAGRQLEDGRRLREYGIQNEAIIDLVKRLRGC